MPRAARSLIRNADCTDDNDGTDGGATYTGVNASTGSRADLLRGQVRFRFSQVASERVS